MKWIFRLLLIVVMLFAGYSIYIRINKISVINNPMKKLEYFAEKGKWESVKLYAEFILKYPEIGDTTKAREYFELAKNKIRKRRSLLGRAKQFLKGMVTGQPEDVESFLGSLTLDFFLIGDVRDLIIQGLYKPVVKKEKPDVLITALSAIGIGTTVAPQIDIGVSVAKLFKKLKVFSKKFIKILENLASVSVKTRKFGKLKNIVSDLGEITTKVGLAPTADMVKYVNNVDELEALTKAVEKNSVETYGVILSTDGKVLKTIKSEEDVIKITERMRKSSRLAKIIRNSKLLKIGYKLSYVLPTNILYTIFIFSLVFLIMSFLIKH